MFGSSHEKFRVWLRPELVFVIPIQIMLLLKSRKDLIRLCNPRVKRKLCFVSCPFELEEKAAGKQLCILPRIILSGYVIIAFRKQCTVGHVTQLQEATGTAKIIHRNGEYLCMRKNILIVLSLMASFKYPANQACNIIHRSHLANSGAKLS